MYTYVCSGKQHIGWFLFLIKSLCFVSNKEEQKSTLDQQIAYLWSHQWLLNLVFSLPCQRWNILILCLFIILKTSSWNRFKIFVYSYTILRGKKNHRFLTNAWKNVFSITENIPCSLLAKREKVWRLIFQLDVRSFLKTELSN